MDIYDLLNCTEHGWLRHAAIHEAGHAAVGIERGGPVIRVTLGVETFGPSGAISGGLTHLDDHHPGWYRSDPVSSFAFTVAGGLAEEVCLGHALEGGQRADFDKWRYHNGHSAPGSVQDLEVTLGRTAQGLFAETTEWLSSRMAQLLAIAEALERRRELSASEVRELLREKDA